MNETWFDSNYSWVVLFKNCAVHSLCLNFSSPICLKTKFIKKNIFIQTNSFIIFICRNPVLLVPVSWYFEPHGETGVDFSGVQNTIWHQALGKWISAKTVYIIMYQFNNRRFLSCDKLLLEKKFNKKKKTYFRISLWQLFLH